MRFSLGSGGGLLLSTLGLVEQQSTASVLPGAAVTMDVRGVSCYEKRKASSNVLPSINIFYRATLPIKRPATRKPRRQQAWLPCNQRRTSALRAETRKAGRQAFIILPLEMQSAERPHHKGLTRW